MSTAYNEWREHSIVLNRICWMMSEALGDVVGDEQKIDADPVELTKRLIDQKRPLRLVRCEECGITFSSHPDFLNHLTAIERHKEKENDITPAHRDRDHT